MEEALGLPLFHPSTPILCYPAYLRVVFGRAIRENEVPPIRLQLLDDFLGFYCKLVFSLIGSMLLRLSFLFFLFVTDCRSSKYSRLFLENGRLQAYDTMGPRKTGRKGKT